MKNDFQGSENILWPHEVASTSKYNQFDFEQQIMECWRVTNDLETVSEYVMETDSKAPEYKDTVANMLLGLEALYNSKFDKLFRMFEEQNKERYKLLRQLEALNKGDL